MLFIDAKELREKGSIALLQNGAVIKAIDKEMLKVLDDIEDTDTDPKEKRKIKVEFAVTSTHSRNSISLDVDIATSLAKKKVMQMGLAIEKAITDEGMMITMKEEQEEADGQQNIDGEESHAESITYEVPEKTNIVEAEFVEKEADTDTLSNDDTENSENEESVTIGAESGLESILTQEELDDLPFGESETEENNSDNMEFEF